MLHLSAINVNMLFLRDTSQSWYLMGVPGVSGSVGETVNFIRAEIQATGATSVVCLGSSMGAFAAILHGTLLRANRCVCFGPQLILAGTARERLLHDLPPAPYAPRLEGVVRHLHTRWCPRLAKLHDAAEPLAIEEVLDLSRLLQRREGPSRIDVHVGEKNPLDLRAARRLERDARGLVPLTLHLYAGRGHNVVTHLRNTGELADILRVVLHAPSSLPTAQQEMGAAVESSASETATVEAAAAEKLRKEEKATVDE